jgi:O-antigen/teichoic acid export membrane protein
VENRIPLPKSVLSPNLLSRARLLSQFVSVQLLVQALAAVSGILLVRVLSQHEYAYFTIANSMLATMGILADSGVSIGLTSIGGKVWQDRQRFGGLISTALHLRRYLALMAATVVAPILMWLLLSNGASKSYAATITALVLLALNFQLMAGVRDIVPRLHSQVGRLQKLDAMAAATRLVLLVTACMVFLNAGVAIFAGLTGIVMQYGFLKRWTIDNIEPQAPINLEDQKTILGIVKHQAPNAVFYCLQGQMTVWLISIFGNTHNIAEIGALGRLSVIFAVINSVMSSIVLPGFARCQSPALLRRRYFQIVGGFILLGGSLILFAALFPDLLLWILGNKYAHLRHELLLMMTMSAANALLAAMWSSNSTKAWIQYSWLNIPGVMVMQAILLMLVDISTVNGVLEFGIFSLIPTFVLNAILTYRGLSKRELSPIDEGEAEVEAFNVEFLTDEENKQSGK